MTKTIVILAAGRGARFKELTRDRPKHLLEVCGKPFLYWSLQNIKKAGFKKIILVIGHKGEKMREFAKKYRKQFKLTLIDQFKILGERKYGTGAALLSVKKEIKNENFICVYGDNLLSEVNFLRARQLNDKYNYTSAYPIKKSNKYGLVIQNNSILKEIKEKAQTSKRGLINAGLYKFTPEIFKALEKIKKSVRGEYELTDAVNILAQKNIVKTLELKDYWLHFGVPADIKIVERFLKQPGCSLNHDN